ncbi:hypothetical protein OK18_19115 [Chryseobacterium gallinarum]|uniref:Uncharacterized protein n=1 Tax=Chryseobacterium gallinarum TaxID=1324352 RepID=A0A0G3M8Y1_CHRGL|nr:hypothetical protein [Chryseobacterium gallinarum]AKK74443.1 hypothetical protein OK18_19115 [Chryseobacterium gallinarum]
MKKYIDKALDYFKRHPLNEECYITSDGRVFHTAGAAQGFAGTLDDQTIESYNKKVLEKEGRSNDLISGSEAERTAKIKELESLELSSANYNLMKPLVKFFGIETADQKAETLIAALTEFKTTLNP